ncbi:unnamed protein product [Penicillium manginii]
MSRLRDSGVPLWVLEHERRQRDMSTLLASLKDSPKGNTITYDMENRIELNYLDLETGLTHPSVTPYFRRRDHLGLLGKPTLMKTRSRFLHAEKGLKPDADLKLYQALAHEIDIQVGRHYRELEFEKAVPYEWEDILSITRDRKVSSNTQVQCRIRRAVEVVEERRNHRMALLQMSAHADPDKPTATELQVLLRLMKDGDWERRVRWQLDNKKVTMHKKTHHVVPVLLVTTFLGGQVRVVWGYFDQKLKVQYTELRQFTSSNLGKSLDDLMMWALPVVPEYTTHFLPMPSIAETDEVADSMDSDDEPAVKIPLIEIPLVAESLVEEQNQISCPSRERKTCKKRRKNQQKGDKKRRR